MSETGQSKTGTASYAFSEVISTPQDRTYIASAVEVRTDFDGYFITIETDPYEGQAMITLPCAKLLIGALRRAVGAARKERKKLALPVERKLPRKARPGACR